MQFGSVKTNENYCFVTASKIFHGGNEEEVNLPGLLGLADASVDYTTALQEMVDFMLDRSDEMQEQEQKIIRFSFFTIVITLITICVLLPEIKNIRGLPVPILAIVDDPGGGKTSQVDFWTGIFRDRNGRNLNLIRSDVKNKEFERALEDIEGSFLFLDDFYVTNSDRSRTRMGGKELILREIFAGNIELPIIMTGESAAVEKFGKSIASRMLILNLNGNILKYGNSLKKYTRRNADKNVSSAIFSRYISSLIGEMNTPGFREHLKSAREEIHQQNNDMSDREKDQFFFLSLSLEMFCRFLKKESFSELVISAIQERKEEMRIHLFVKNNYQKASDLQTFEMLFKELREDENLHVSSINSVESHCYHYAKAKYTDRIGLCKKYTDYIDQLESGEVYTRGDY